MRRLLPFVLLIAPACAQQDQPTSTDHQEIVGGVTDTGDPAVPIVAFGGGLCTGTVISPHVILTAGHCSTATANQYEIRFENQYGDNTGPTLTVSAVLKNTTGDMGLLAMTDPAPMAPIPINTESLDTHHNEPTRIVGFGVTSENGQDSGLKRQGAETLLDATLEEGGLIYTSTGPQGTCYGDSGGPNFMTIGGREVVVGVTTTGTDVCGSGMDIGSRVDTFAPWIQAFIDAHEVPATCDGDGQCASGCDNPDPDCPCANDGLCTIACGDLSADPDCDGCGADGTCRQGCPIADPDCAGMPDAGNGAGDDTGGGGGCCSATGETPASAIVLALFALVVLRRRR